MSSASLALRVLLARLRRLSFMPMSTTKPNYPCFSADVRMHLHMHGHSYTIGQIGPDFIMLADTCEHSPAEAEIVMTQEA